MKSKTTLLQVACIVSLITSIITLCLSIPRSQEFNFDYLGLLVGIQSLIVTILIGWNIYCLVDLKGMRGEQDKMKQDAFLNLQRICAITCHATSDVYYRYLEVKNQMVMIIILCTIGCPRYTIHHYSVIIKLAKS